MSDKALDLVKKASDLALELLKTPTKGRKEIRRLIASYGYKNLTSQIMAALKHEQHKPLQHPTRGLQQLLLSQAILKILLSEQA